MWKYIRVDSISLLHFILTSKLVLYNMTVQKTLFKTMRSMGYNSNMVSYAVKQCCVMKQWF